MSFKVYFDASVVSIDEVEIGKGEEVAKVLMPILEKMNSTRESVVRIGFDENGNIETRTPDKGKISPEVKPYSLNKDNWKGIEKEIDKIRKYKKAGDGKELDRINEVLMRSFQQLLAELPESEVAPPAVKGVDTELMLKAAILQEPVKYAESEILPVAREVIEHADWPSKPIRIILATKAKDQAEYESAIATAIQVVERRLRKPDLKFNDVEVKIISKIEEFEEAYYKFAQDGNAHIVSFLEAGIYDAISAKLGADIDRNDKASLVKEMIPEERGYISILGHIALGIGLIDLKANYLDNGRYDPEKTERLGRLIFAITMNHEISKAFINNPHRLYTGTLVLILPRITDQELWDNIKRHIRGEAELAVAL